MTPQIHVRGVDRCFLLPNNTNRLSGNSAQSGTAAPPNAELPRALASCAQVRLIECRTSSDPPALTVWVRDISAEGIGLLFPDSVQIGTYLVLSLPTLKRKNATLDLLFLTVRCDPLNEKQFSVGARFQRVITAEDVK